MATLEECRAALERLATQLSATDGARQRAQAFDRSISCHLPDLGVTFAGHLRGGRITELSTEPAPRAQIRFTATSDDLVAVTDGRLPAGEAWRTGRLKVHASMMDLLKLKSMF